MVICEFPTFIRANVARLTIPSPGPESLKVLRLCKSDADTSGFVSEGKWWHEQFGEQTEDELVTTYVAMVVMTNQDQLNKHMELLTALADNIRDRSNTSESPLVFWIEYSLSVPGGRFRKIHTRTITSSTGVGLLGASKGVPITLSAMVDWDTLAMHGEDEILN